MHTLSSPPSAFVPVLDGPPSSPWTHGHSHNAANTMTPNSTCSSTLEPLSSPEPRQPRGSLHPGLSSSGKRGRPRADLITHLMMEGSSSPSEIKCRVCNRVFPREKSLQAHLRTHTGERPYCCDFPGCSRAFTQSGQLKTHQRLHAGEKPFMCSSPGCSNRYTHANRTCPLHPCHKPQRTSDLVLSASAASEPGIDPAALASPEVARWLENYRRGKQERAIAASPATPTTPSFDTPIRTSKRVLSHELEQENCLPVMAAVSVAAAEADAGGKNDAKSTAEGVGMKSPLRTAMDNRRANARMQCNAYMPPGWGGLGLCPNRAPAWAQPVLHGSAWAQPVLHGSAQAQPVLHGSAWAWPVPSHGLVCAGVPSTQVEPQRHTDSPIGRPSIPLRPVARPSLGENTRVWQNAYMTPVLGAMTPNPGPAQPDPSHRPSRQTGDVVRSSISLQSMVENTGAREIACGAEASLPNSDLKKFLGRSEVKAQLRQLEGCEPLASFLTRGRRLDAAFWLGLKEQFGERWTPLLERSIKKLRKKKLNRLVAQKLRAARKTRIEAKRQRKAELTARNAALDASVEADRREHDEKQALLEEKARRKEERQRTREARRIFKKRYRRPDPAPLPRGNPDSGPSTSRGNPDSGPSTSRGNPDSGPSTSRG